MMKKKLTAVLLTVSILSTAFSMSVASKEEKPETPTVSSTENVTYIVTLDSDSLIDIAVNSNGEYTNVADILLSENAESYLSEIKAKQEQMKIKIQSAVPQANFADSTSYTAIFSGFTVEAPSDALSAIESVDGVKGVSLSKQVEIRKQSEDSLTMREKSSGFTDEVNAKYAYDNGYTGKGILIADIDSSFDLNHEVFSAVPEDGKYDKEEIKILYENSGFNTNEKYGIDDVYKSGKVVFAYDYGEDDTDTYLSGDDHGTHTAGIAAGNNGKTGDDQFRGVAYDAQFALLKISDDHGELTSDEAILSACDDSVKLGADVINCSFGENRGAVTGEYADAFEKMQEIDIMVCGAQSNSSVNGKEYFDLAEKPFAASCIDYSTNGDVASFPHTLAVGSVNLRNVYVDCFMLGDQKVSYSNAMVEDMFGLMEENPDFFETIAPGTEYVFIDALGNEEDYKDVDVKGKVAIVNRGTIPFLEKQDAEKQDAAVKNGAVGLIIVNNEPGTFVPIVDEFKIPVIMVDLSVKEYLIKNPTGTIGEKIGMVAVDSGSTLMSTFSSFGVSADLRLTPQISAPGSLIYSSVSDNKYEYFEGTSMATPNIAGCAALVKQKLNETSKDTNKRASVFSQLTSKSNTLTYGDGTYYSPRLQGSGMVDLENTLKSDQTITVDGEEKAVANLKDNTSGSYSFRFNVVNHSNEEVTYNMNYAIQTDKGEMIDGKSVNALEPVSIADKADVVLSDENGAPVSAVTLKANETKTVSVTIKLHDDFIAENNKMFTNGFYVDGYVFLTPTDDTDSSLHVTFMGFCGDWSEIPLFDNTVYDEGDSVFPLENVLIGGNFAAVFNGVLPDVESKTTFMTGPLGGNLFTGTYDGDKISFGLATIYNYASSVYGSEARSYIGDDLCIIPNFYMFRDAYNAELSVSDADGNLLYSITNDIITANYDSMPMFNTVNIFFDYDTNTLDEYVTKFFKTLPDGKYSITLSGEIMDSDGTTKNRQRKTYSFYFDNVNPTMTYTTTETVDGNKSLDITVADNVAPMGAEILVEDPYEPGEYVVVDNYFFEMYEYYDPDFEFDDYSDETDEDDTYEDESEYHSYSVRKKTIPSALLADGGIIEDEPEPYGELKENDDGTVTMMYDITYLTDFLSERDINTDIKIRGVDYAYNFSDEVTISLVNNPQESSKPESSSRVSEPDKEVSDNSNELSQTNSEVSKAPSTEVKGSSTKTGTSAKTESSSSSSSTVSTSSTADTTQTGDSSPTAAIAFVVMLSAGAVVAFKKRIKE